MLLCRFLREPNTESGKYYVRLLKRKRAKLAEIEKLKLEAQERAERERLAQEKLKRERDEEADGESDDGSNTGSSKRVSILFMCDNKWSLSAYCHHCLELCDSRTI